MPSGDGAFNDSELDRLLAAIHSPDAGVAYFGALFAELVAGARDAVDDDERERYGQQALIVGTALAATRASKDVANFRATLLARATETQGDRRAQVEAATDRGVAEVEQRFDELGERIATLEALLVRVRQFVEHTCDDESATQ
jgi:hypothetical protein